MLMHGAYIRPSAILDGNKAARILIPFLQRQPASSCGLIPRESPRRALDFSSDETIREVDVSGIHSDSVEPRVFI